MKFVGVEDDDLSFEECWWFALGYLNGISKEKIPDSIKIKIQNVLKGGKNEIFIEK